MYSTMTLLGTFWFYSAIAFIGVVVLYFALPETENISLHEIEANFDSAKRAFLRQQELQLKRDQQSPTTSDKIHREDMLV